MRKLSYQEKRTVKNEVEKALDADILSGEDALDIMKIITEAEKRDKDLASVKEWHKGKGDA